MRTNHLMMAWRQWRSTPSYSLINLGGLTAGLVVTILIGLWINDELTFDHYHQNHQNLAQVMNTQPIGGLPTTTAQMPVPLAAELRMRDGRYFRHLALVFPNFPHAVAAGDHKITASGVWAQPDFPVMLSLKMIRGSSGALKDPSSFLLDQSTARALFGAADPMGRTIRIDNVIDVKVGGVFEDLPANTSFAGTRLILAWDKAASEMPFMKDFATDWTATGFWLFAEMNNAGDQQAIERSIKNILVEHAKGSKQTLSLEPMDRWHLYSEFRNGRSSGGRIRIVRLFGVIGIFVLLLACINFMNLSTARSERRAKEVGIRKTLGSLRRQLIRQFLAESLLLTVLAFILAIGIVQLSFPLFNRLAGKNMSIPWSDSLFWLRAAGFILFTGFLAGSYPAFYLSGFKPITVLKGAGGSQWGTRGVGPLAGLFRKILVILQFAVSISLIIGTFIIYRQIQYAKARPVGYEREGLLAVRMNTGDLYAASYATLRDDLLRTGVVEDMAESEVSATQIPENFKGIEWEGKDPATTPPISLIAVTHDFGRTLGWKMAEGRDYSRTFATDSTAIMLNESAVRLIGWRDPVGKIIKILGTPYHIIGVVKDMVMGSPYQPVPATIFAIQYQLVNFISIRLKTANSGAAAIPTPLALNRIEKVFSKYNPAAPFEYQFTDEAYGQKFAGEQQVAGLATFFATLAIFISCLGLFGLASYMAEQRKREVGIRKVLGAAISQLWQLLTRDFLLLILISCGIAVPLMAWLMHRWLQQYEYRTPIDAWIFVLACGGALLLAISTVSYQAIKAARSNPVKSLRSQ